MAKLPVLLALALTALQAFDGWTTYRILKAGGVERNPVMLWLMERIGTYPALLATKMLAVALVWVIALAPMDTRLRFLALSVLCAVYAWVAWNNWLVYRRLGRSR
jgi:hypothetical protein